MTQQFLVALSTVVLNAVIAQAIAWRQARASYERGRRVGRLEVAMRRRTRGPSSDPS